MANPLLEQFGEVLLEKISRDTYPSNTQMDMLEAIATPQVRVLFIFHLMERIEDDKFPSIPMMQRAQRLIMSFGA